jgi:hypothetical protein
VTPPSFQIADASRNASFAIAFDMPCVMWTAMVSDDGTGAAGSHVNVEINASHIMEQRDVPHHLLVSCANADGVLAKSDGVRAYHRKSADVDPSVFRSTCP